MSDIKIVMMNGGLVDQMYQYTFIRYIEMITNSKCLVDDSACFENGIIEHNGYELERIYNIKLNCLSTYFSKDTWEEMIRKKNLGISIPQQLLENGMDLMLVAESDDYVFEGNQIYFSPSHFDIGTLMAIASVKGCVYYHGYWVSSIFFSMIKEDIIKEFVFPPIKETYDIDTINKQYENLIYLTNSVAVHIRRGDFVECGSAVSPEKYLKAINIFETKYSDCTYFIFSDDIQWCKENEAQLGIEGIQGDVIYIEENDGNGNNYIDMQLMSQCKKMIISDSSFGAWAYYLNKNPHLEVLEVNKL